MGNKNLIITIEREYGSGGRIVGKKLAEELGIHFYDDDILKLASEKSAVGEQFFRLADEKAGNNLPINTTKLTLEETAELIKAYIRLKGFMD